LSLVGALISEKYYQPSILNASATQSMSESPDKLEALFDAVVELPPAERQAYLNRACGDDEELRRRVERLLRNLEPAGGFLTPEEAPSAERLPSMAEKPGDRIGHYKLLERIGEGGCGVVYMAEQEEPVRRRVALKIIKLGIDTQTVIARFEAERQALAASAISNTTTSPSPCRRMAGSPGRRPSASTRPH
jgi:hypothetical protein